MNKNIIAIGKNQRIPKLTLNVMDKIYLAVAVKSADKLTFIYTLACLRTGNQYGLLPDIEVSAFDNENDAAIYHKTIKQIMLCQEKHKGMQQIKNILGDKVKEFNEMLR